MSPRTGSAWACTNSMVIYLTKSKLFTEEPDIRFCKEYNLPKGFWTDMWRRYALLDYSLKDLCDMYELKSGRKTTGQAMKRWINRTEVYCRAQDAIRKGAEVAMSSYFGEFEEFLLKEIARQMRFSVKGENKILI